MMFVDRITSEICEARDADAVINTLWSLEVDLLVFRALAAAFAKDVLFLSDTPHAHVAVEAAIGYARGRIGLGVLSTAHTAIAGTCEQAKTPPIRFARFAARAAVSVFDDGVSVARAAAVAGEAALLVSQTRTSPQSVRLHQADIARAYLTPETFASFAEGQVA